jgi:ATP/ADP translocase
MNKIILNIGLLIFFVSMIFFSRDDNSLLLILLKSSVISIITTILLSIITLIVIRTINKTALDKNHSSLDELEHSNNLNEDKLIGNQKNG